MKEFIILSRGDIMALRKDEPVRVWVDKKPMILCSDEYFENQKVEAENERRTKTATDNFRSV